MSSTDWITSLPEPEKAEAPEKKKDGSMATGRKSLELPQSVIEWIHSGEWFSQGGIPNGRAAKAFIYAVGKVAREHVTAEAPNGYGLKVQVDSPAILRKNLTLDTPGPITLRLNAGSPVDDRRGPKKKLSGAAFDILMDDLLSKPEPPDEPTDLRAGLSEADEVASRPLSEAEMEILSPAFKSPGAFVDPDAPADPRDED